MRKFNVTVNGKAYEVEVEETGAPVAATPVMPVAAAAAPAAPAAAPKAAAPAPAAAPKAAQIGRAHV